MHVNPAAMELMGEFIYHRRWSPSRSRGERRHTLAEAVRAALVDGLADPREIGPAGDLVAHVAAMPADPDDPYQFLRAVVLLSRDPRSAPH